MKKTIILLSAGLMSLNLNAAIQYTDLSPDSTASVSSGGYMDIDVDGDNTEDFTFSLNGMGTSMYSVSISTFHEIVTDNLANNPNSSYASALFSGTEINSSNRWADYTRNVRLDDQSKRNFEGKGERFIGFRLDKGGDYYYGWMLVELTGSLELRVKSFAFEDSPNTPIVIGDTGSNTIGLSEQPETQLQLYPSIVTQNLQVEGSFAIGEFVIFDQMGRAVNSGTPDESVFSLDLSNLSHGTYLIQLVDETGNRYIQRFVKRD